MDKNKLRAGKTGESWCREVAVGSNKGPKSCGKTGGLGKEAVKEEREGSEHLQARSREGGEKGR